MSDQFTITQLANKLEVTVSTVTRWTGLADSPLPVTGTGRGRRIDWSDYVSFARQHPQLRGVTKQARTRMGAQPQANAKATRKALISALGQLDTLVTHSTDVAKLSTEARQRLRTALAAFDDKE